MSADDLAALRAVHRAANLADAVALANRKAAAEAQTNWELCGEPRRGFRLDRWAWWVTADGQKVAEGTALTKAQMETRRYRAYLAELDRRAADGGEGGNRRRDIETSKLINRWKPWVN